SGPGVLAAPLAAPISAPCFVARSPADLAGQETRGKLLIAAAGWAELLPLLGGLAGLVCPHGGALSHIAIQARAAGCPCLMAAGRRGEDTPNGAPLTIPPDSRLEGHQPPGVRTQAALCPPPAALDKGGAAMRHATARLAAPPAGRAAASSHDPSPEM